MFRIIKLIKEIIMSKLKLKNITKLYEAGDSKVEALRGINLDFDGSGFVSILGPSGCGKTTLLNIIGGLDKYSSGDLIISGVSTKDYKDRDWDAYRNSQIGFVFQNYNLISHQTVLENVEIALTLTGVSPKERERRSMKVLSDLGLGDQAKKKPNQLSGGQMQRVAIARALVNNPNILLADEPTGALDSKTSVQIMEILKEISKEKLVIMVTHNSKLAKEYSDRTIELLDGKVLSDSQGNTKQKDEELTVAKENKKTAMSYFTALSLSFKNLLTKMNRTIITSIAGSIGIVGVALVLALSNGLTRYINDMQSESLAGFPLTVSSGEQMMDLSSIDYTAMMNGEEDEFTKFTDEDVLYSYNRFSNTEAHINVFTDEYMEYLSKMEKELPDAINTISYSRAVNINLLSKVDGKVALYDTNTASQGMMPMGNILSYFNEISDNDEFVLSLYDLIGEGSRLPETKNEIAIVVDSYNRVSSGFFEKLGIADEELKLSDFIGKPLLKVIPNNEFYKKTNGVYVPIASTEYDSVYDSPEGAELVVTGILRKKDEVAASFLPEGVVYTRALTDYIVESAKTSDIAIAQSNSDTDVLSGFPFPKEEMKAMRLLSLGAESIPVSVNIYPKDFDSKDLIKEHLDEYNKGKEKKDQVLYSDIAESMTGAVGRLIDTVTYVLVGFAAISLVVSTIMIAIITYVSVIERTKEIGILRSVGARKKDITRIFNAETIIIGFVAGMLGVGLSYLLSIPINSILFDLVGIKGLASLNPISAVLLVLGSMVLTLIAGAFPARMAAQKDPVVALRTE